MIGLGTLDLRGMVETRSLARLEERLKPHREVEAYFSRSGRTLRKGRFRLWFNETIKPRLLRALFRALGVYDRWRGNALDVQFRRLDIHLRRLPKAFDGFTILQISDVHIDKLNGLAERIADLVWAHPADICVLTGDYRYEIRGDCADVYPRMQTILSRVRTRDGSFGILGNHDAAEIAIQLETMGVRMLVNDAVRLEKNGGRIWLAGVDDPFDYRCHDLALALKEVPEHEICILLAHTPALYAEAEAAGVDFYLCGHTHAGQIRLPFLGALKKNGAFPRQFVQDLWRYRRMQGYTSWGAGCSTLPVRFNCPPEVTLFTLRQA